MSWNNIWLGGYLTNKGCLANMHIIDSLRKNNNIFLRTITINQPKLRPEFNNIHSQKMVLSFTKTTLMRLCMVVIISFSMITAAPTAVQRMIGALRQRDITTSFGVLSSLQTVDFNAVGEMTASPEQQQQQQQHAPTQITLLDDPQFILTLLAIPVGFSFPLHSRPGLPS